MQIRGREQKQVNPQEKLLAFSSALRNIPVEEGRWEWRRESSEIIPPKPDPDNTGVGKRRDRKVERF